MITEVFQAVGSFDLRLNDQAPNKVRRAIQQKGTIVVTPCDLPPAGIDVSTVLSAARYAGMVRSVSLDGLDIHGISAVGFLGDDSNPMIGPWPFFTASQWEATFSGMIQGCVWSDTGNPRNGIGPQIVSGALSGTKKVNVAHLGSWTTSGTTLPLGPLPVRAQLQVVCEAFGAEWKFNPRTAKVMCGGPANLFTNIFTAAVLIAPEIQYTPKPRGGAIVGLPLVELDGDRHSHTWADNMQMNLTPPDGVTSVTSGSASRSEDFAGYAGEPNAGSYIASVIRDGAAELADANFQAAILLANEFGLGFDLRTLEVQARDITRHLIPGDWCGIYVPEARIMDTTEGPFHLEGRPFPAQRFRIHSVTWAVEEGMGVWHISSDGLDEVTWLTPHMEWENGNPRLQVGTTPLKLGDFLRSVGKTKPGYK